MYPSCASSQADSSSHRATHIKQHVQFASLGDSYEPAFPQPGPNLPGVLWSLYAKAFGASDERVQDHTVFWPPLMLSKAIELVSFRKE